MTDRSTDEGQTTAPSVPTSPTDAESVDVSGAITKTIDLYATAAQPPSTTEYVSSNDPSPFGGVVGPTQIGKYRVVQLLGRGGQATVYRAVHTEIPGRDVVIKWANADLAPDAQRSILDEGRILAELDDPGLVRVYDVDMAEGRPYVVFEYVAGRTLHDEAKGTTIEPRRAASIVADLAHTLEQAHRRGVLHRDLKPANILIDAQGRTRVLDFGLGTSSSVWTGAKEIDPRISGTLPYMAPEQAAGDASDLGPWTDVFGLGAILYDLLVGRPPHQLKGLQLRQAIDRVRLCDLESPRKIRPTIPQDLETIVLRALHADPSKRFANAGEFETALRSHLRRPARRRLLAGLAGAVILLAIGATVWWTRPEPVVSEVMTREIPSMTPSAATLPLDGRLNVRIWSADGKVKSGLPITDPGALPVRNGEQVHLEASLNRAAYLYLLWIDSEGKVTRLDDVTGHAPRSELHSPAKLDQGWEMIGAPGLETIVLLAAEKPLAADTDLATLIGTLPATGPSAGDGFVAFDIEGTPAAGTSSCVKVTGGGGETRGLGAIKTINDPVVQSLERLRERFDLVKAIRFAHR
jgi:serine/threonine protein kinase